MGYCENSGMGYVALSFTEIYNYMKATQTPLTSSEVMLIRKASQSYVSETYNKNPFAKEPYFVEKEIPLKNYILLSIVLILTIVVVIYFFLWNQANCQKICF